MAGSSLSDEAVHGVRTALEDASFTVDAVADLLGPVAHGALGRNETVPALRRTRDGSPLSTLVRLWLLQDVVPRDQADAALPGVLGALVGAGILEQSGGDVRARVDIRPYGDQAHDWWIVSDLTPGLDGTDRRVPADHVLGVSGASTSLAQLTVPTTVERALDLGTGSGVQAVHLAQQARSVVATDVNPRCLLLADLTARLNRVDVDLREGNLWDPVSDERFDLVVTNPPFVVSPAAGTQLLYRDSGLPGDQLVEDVITGAAARLTPGGRCQLLANWVHQEGRPWDERLQHWLVGTGCDAWAVQREVADPARYVALWLDDAGLRGHAEYTARYDAWLAWFEEQRIEGIGFGWVVLSNAGAETPYIQVESWPYEVEQPLGPYVDAWCRAVQANRRIGDETLMRARLRASPDVVEERFGQPGAADPERIVIRGQRGMRRARQVSTAVAAMVGASDGDLTLGQVVTALSTLLETPPELLREELLDAARSHLIDGLLLFEG